MGLRITEVDGGQVIEATENACKCLLPRTSFELGAVFVCKNCSQRYKLVGRKVTDSDVYTYHWQKGAA